MVGDLRAVDTKQNAPGERGAGTAGTIVEDTSIVPPEEHSVKSMCDEALALAALGFRVHPVYTPADAKGNEDPTKKGKTPRLTGWRDLATTDPEIIDGWLREWPNTNMGVRTGVNLAVVDVDGPEGQASIKGRAMPPTLTVRTGRGDGGLHYWFKMPEGKNYRNRVGLLPGIDIRGEGGQAVVPPSLHGSGQRYKWADYMSPDEIDRIPPLPDWVCDMLDLAERFTGDTSQAPAKSTDTTTPYGKGAIRNISATMVSATKGTRNNTLFICAAALGNLVGGGEIAEADARAALEKAALENGVMDDEPAETAATITSGLSKGRQEPRCAPEQAADTKTTQAEILYDLAQKADYFRSSEGTGYATTPELDTYELCERGGSFRHWLIRQFRAEQHRAPSTSALQQAMMSILAEAAIAPIRQVAVRTAATDDGRALWLDLGGEVVKIDDTGWTITTKLSEDLCFLRPDGFRPLPNPTRGGGGIDRLRSILSNVTNDDFILIVAWLVAALRPGEPVPVLVLTGEQGSAKSTTAKILRYLIDPIGPDGAGLTCPPKDTKDIFAICNTLHVLALDNVSYLSTDMSDTLSAIATGVGQQLRKLYTDNVMSATYVKRPIIINGIGTGAADIAGRADLLDRAISIHLSAIPDTKRRDDAEVWREVKAAAPAILGDLLTAANVALKRLPEVNLTSRPRMASFASWIVAAEPALPWGSGDFMKIYEENRDAAAANMLDGDIIAGHISALANYADENGELIGWCGTAAEMLRHISARDDEMAKQKWTPRKLSQHLVRIEPALKKAGVTVKRDRSHGRSYIILARAHNGCT